MIILRQIVLHYYTDLNLPSVCKDPGKQARKGFRPPFAMKGIGYFQN